MMLTLDLIQPKRQDGNTDAADATDLNGFFPPAADKEEPKASQSPFHPFDPFYNHAALRRRR